MKDDMDVEVWKSEYLALKTMLRQVPPAIKKQTKNANQMTRLNKLQ
jgi:hypothetical protein